MKFTLFALPALFLGATASRVVMGRATLAGRGFHTTARRMADAPLAAKKPMGAFRGGLFGFLLGCTLAGSSVYTYLVQEYKASNDMLTDDIYVRRFTYPFVKH
ncbi:hypothetical protein NLG97_g5120 [Lecanicillium saksenae]|uniref:Uncharacterized protein n=1 Tax=Lecanicillium saksenae TaxID=468837 RepID=A0ACC1QUJ1_9HYPO|nr:hypothetical protein NLG97_g5120 [Lecanicillium saksenae]